jgi:hypothetical protein
MAGERHGVCELALRDYGVPKRRLIDQSTRRDIPEDLNLLQLHRASHKPRDQQRSSVFC